MEVLAFHAHTTFVPFLIVTFFEPKKSSFTATCLGFGFVVAAIDGSATAPAATAIAATGRTSFLI